MRSLTVHLHRWAGLATALFLAVAGLTGTLLAFKNELEATLNPALFSVTPPSGRGKSDMLDPFVLREQLQRLHPEARADHMSFPAAGKSVMFYLMPRTDPSSGQAYPLEHDQIFVDPYSGEVLGQRRWGELFTAGRFNRENIIPFVWRLHEALALPHPWGKLLMGVIALIWTIDCFIGLCLTFPRGRPFLQKWRPAWQIKRGASAYRLNLDVHRSAGLWLWIVLLVFAWSSVMLNLREIVYQPVMSLAFEFRNERPPRLPEPRWTPALDWRQAHGMAQNALESLAQQQGFEVEAEDSLWYRPAQGAYMFRARTSLDIRDEGGGTELWIDGDTGQLLKVQQEGRAASGDTLSTWLRFLHTGQVFGISYRIAVGIVGVIVAILSVTGVVIWLVKRNARHNAIDSHSVHWPAPSVVPLRPSRPRRGPFPSMTSLTSTTRPLDVANRIAASLLGSWAFVWGFSTLGITGLVALGQPYDEARTAVMQLAFLVFLAAFCWTFAAASMSRVWSVLGGGAALMTGAAWLLQRSLV